MTEPLVLSELSDGIARVTLNRAARHNALVPELVEALRTALGRARAAGVRALVLTGAGRSFSTGGDIAGFLAAAASDEALRRYARELVGGLNAAILDLIDFPAPVIARVNGPVTGGALGLVMASDLVAIDETAFVQPYYVEIGFAPDGGWTALLPDRIGAGRAMEIQLLNRRVAADEAVHLGLASRALPESELDACVAAWLGVLAGHEPGSLAATRRQVWDAPRRQAVAARLDAECARFVERVADPEVRRRMGAFTARA